jgi:peptidyl-prolyl cis-trans isomerase C
MMKAFQRPAVTVAWLGLAILWNPLLAQSDEAQVLGSGEGFEVTTDLIDAELSIRPVFQSQQLRLSEPALKELINEFFRREAVVALAEQKKIWEQDPQAAYRLERVRREELMAIMLDHKRQEIAASMPDLTEQAKEAYQANPEKYLIPEQIQAAHVLLKAASQEEIAQRRDEAKAILTRAQQGEDFAKLAREFSEDEGSASQGGDLGFFPRGRMVAEFEEAAFALQEPGEISDIVETPFGLHIIKLESRRPEQQLTFEKVKDSLIISLKQKYVRERLQDWYQQVSDPSQVSANHQAIDEYVKKTKEAAEREPRIRIPDNLMR